MLHKIISNALGDRNQASYFSVFGGLSWILSFLDVTGTPVPRPPVAGTPVARTKGISILKVGTLESNLNQVFKQHFNQHFNPILNPILNGNET